MLQFHVKMPKQAISPSSYSSATWLWLLLGRKWLLLHSTSLSPGHNIKNKPTCLQLLLFVTICSTLLWHLTFCLNLRLYTSAGTTHIHSVCFPLYNCVWLWTMSIVVCNPTFIVVTPSACTLVRLTYLSRGMMYCALCTRYNKENTICMSLEWREVWVCVCVYVCAHISEHEGTKPSPYGPLFWKGMTLAPLPWMLGE